jgi:hypothetical protein
MVRDSKEFSINSPFYVKKGGHVHLGVVFASQLLRHFLTPAPPLSRVFIFSQSDKLRMPQVPHPASIR